MIRHLFDAKVLRFLLFLCSFFCSQQSSQFFFPKTFLAFSRRPTDGPISAFFDDLPHANIRVFSCQRYLPSPTNLEKPPFLPQSIQSIKYDSKYTIYVQLKDFYIGFSGSTSRVNNWEGENGEDDLLNPARVENFFSRILV